MNSPGIPVAHMDDQVDQVRMRSEKFTASYVTWHTPFCLTCKLREQSPAPRFCLAFPEGIPTDVLIGKADHTNPLKGDNGLQYEKGDPVLSERCDRREQTTLGVRVDCQVRFHSPTSHGMGVAPVSSTHVQTAANSSSVTGTSTRFENNPVPSCAHAGAPIGPSNWHLAVRLRDVRRGCR